MRKLIFLLPAFLAVLAFSSYGFSLDFLNLDAVTDWRNVSLAIAFLGGVLSFFAPCSIAVLPAFFSYAFKERRDAARMTLVFSLGFSAAFVVLGLAIAYLGKVSFVYFQNDSGLLIQAIGFLLIIFGVMTFLGRGFSFIRLKAGQRHDFFGIFAFGALFAVGWSACAGPIISGILFVAYQLNDYAYSALLLLAYSLGIAVPLFAMAFFFDRYDLSEHPLVKGKSWSFSFLGRDFYVHSTQAVSGLMLTSLGVLFVVFRGTTALTAADLLGKLIVFCVLLIAAYIIYRLVALRLFGQGNVSRVALAALVLLSVPLFAAINSRFSLSTVGIAEDLDRFVLQNSRLFNLVGIVAILAFAFLVWRFALRGGGKRG